jgi:hypothetical protein
MFVWAEYNPYIGRSTHPDIWHLDNDGRFQCYTPSYTTNSLKRYAEDPQDLFISREHGLALGDCPTRWLFIEPLLSWNDHAVPDEADASAFVILRETLEAIGVELVDACQRRRYPAGLCRSIPAVVPWCSVLVDGGGWGW